MADDEIEHELGLSAKERMGQARRQLCRRVCAALVSGMAATDCDLTMMAIRIGKSEAGIREAINRLMDGQSISLNLVSDLFFAMGLELTLNLQRGVLAVEGTEAGKPREEATTTDQS